MDKRTKSTLEELQKNKNKGLMKKIETFHFIYFTSVFAMIMFKRREQIKKYSSPAKNVCRLSINSACVRHILAIDVIKI